jgi:hypothetical protein
MISLVLFFRKPGVTQVMLQLKHVWFFIYVHTKIKKSILYLKMLPLSLKSDGTKHLMEASLA